jgi:hypothetical protein
MENMRRKLVILSTVLICVLEFSLVSVFAASGPKTANMEIHIYDYSYQVNQDLEAGVIDINDQPLTKPWIDKWAQMPDQIAMDSYDELGMAEIDMNNQMWPTGDPYNKFYKLSSIQSNQSLAFRQAVAFLTDRDNIVETYLQGLGFKMIVPLPQIQSAFVDMINYTSSTVTYTVGSNAYELNSSVGGITYPFNRTMAAYILDKAGFVWNSGHMSRIDPSTGQDMKPIIFVIRTDNPISPLVGYNLTKELESAGVPVQPVYVTGEIAARRVMQQYDYNLYTGSWALSTLPTQYYDLYSSDTYYGPSIGWSQNYPGFCNNGTLFGPGHSDSEGFDYWARAVKYVPNQAAYKTAGYLFLKYCASLPLYCLKATKAYRRGWTGVVNSQGYGIDNYWTFLNGYKPDDSQWDYGFSKDTYQLNAVTYGAASPLGLPTPDVYLTTAKTNGLMYESLLGVNPWTLALSPNGFFIANAVTTGSWDATGVSGDLDATFVNFTLRSNVNWHNDMTAGRLLDALDVNFSFYFQKDCGPGVAWNYPSLASFDHCTVYDATHVAVYYNRKSALAVQWAGGLPMLNRDVWLPLWNTSDSGWRMKVKTYDPTTQDNNNNGLADLYEDGTGAWIFKDYVRANYVTLNANSYYYLNQTYVANALHQMFHESGDVTYNGEISVLDLALMARAMFTNSTWIHGFGWDMYNPDCDLNGDGQINILDLATVTANYGKTMG